MPVSTRGLPAIADIVISILHAVRKVRGRAYLLSRFLWLLLRDH